MGFVVGNGSTKEYLEKKTNFLMNNISIRKRANRRHEYPYVVWIITKGNKQFDRK